jgi:hypothetical protein
MLVFCIGYLFRNEAFVNFQSLPQIVAVLEYYLDEQSLKFIEDRILAVPVPGFDKDAVALVQSEVGLQVVHDEGGFHFSSQHRNILNGSNNTLRDSPSRKVRWFRYSRC